MSPVAPSRADPTLDALAQEVIDLEIRRELVRAELLQRMEAESVTRVDAPGGHVVYVASSFGTAVDVKAAVAKLEALGAELRKLGREPDDAIPMKPTERRAGIRANIR